MKNLISLYCLLLISFSFAEFVESYSSANDYVGFMHSYSYKNEVLIYKNTYDSIPLDFGKVVVKELEGMDFVTKDRGYFVMTDTSYKNHLFVTNDQGHTLKKIEVGFDVRVNNYGSANNVAFLNEEELLLVGDSLYLYNVATESWLVKPVEQKAYFVSCSNNTILLEKWGYPYGITIYYSQDKGSSFDSLRIHDSGFMMSFGTIKNNKLYVGLGSPYIANATNIVFKYDLQNETKDSIVLDEHFYGVTPTKDERLAVLGVKDSIYYQYIIDFNGAKSDSSFMTKYVNQEPWKTRVTYNSDATYVYRDNQVFIYIDNFCQGIELESLSLHTEDSIAAIDLSVGDPLMHLSYPQYKIVRGDSSQIQLTEQEEWYFAISNNFGPVPLEMKYSQVIESTDKLIVSGTPYYKSGLLLGETTCVFDLKSVWPTVLFSNEVFDKNIIQNTSNEVITFNEVFDQIDIFSIEGRLLQSELNTDVIEYEGLDLKMILIRAYQGKEVYSTKLILN